MPDVLIPYRPGCEHRERALRWVLDRWKSLGHQPHVGSDADGPWCKAAAIEAALSESTSPVVIVADADVWPSDPDEIRRCVESLEAHRWAIPHGDVHRLDEPSTIDLIDTGTPGDGRAERPYWGRAGGGIVVLRSDTYRDCPIDRRFSGWGQEDESWAMALTTLAGAPYRGACDLWHLWHPPQERLNRRIGSLPGHQLARRYRRAMRNPDAMRALIEEAA